MKFKGPQILTANRLSDGSVVYLSQSDTWSDWLKDARVAADEDAANSMMRVAEQAVIERIIVEPYLMQVAADDNAIRPMNVREAIRARGPSVRPDLGKQADLKG